MYHALVCAGAYWYSCTTGTCVPDFSKKRKVSERIIYNSWHEVSRPCSCCTVEHRLCALLSLRVYSGVSLFTLISRIIHDRRSILYARKHYSYVRGVLSSCQRCRQVIKCVVSYSLRNASSTGREQAVYRLPSEAVVVIFMYVAGIYGVLGIRMDLSAPMQDRP